MSALGFLGGLGQFANSFQQGYEKSEDREQAMKDREYQRQQREFEKGQQQRKLDEQKRADDLRNRDAAVATTETVTTPGSQTIYGNEAPVLRDDEGNLMPGAQETPAQTSKRQRSMDAIYRDYAENRKAQGDTEGYFKYHDMANKQAAVRTSNAYLQVQADAAGKTPLQLAQEIGKIFDSDPMNGGTKSIEPIEGGVRMTLYNKDTGQTSTKDFVGPDANKQILNAFTPYFRPDSYAKLLEKRQEAQVSRAAELLKPYTLRPGEKRQVMGPDGKVITIGEGNLPKGYELATDEAGNTVMRPVATGTKAPGKAPKTPVEEAQDIMKDAMGGKGDGSPEGAARYTRAMSYLDGVFAGNPNVSPRMAVAIASDAAADPTKISLQLDNRTGQVSKVYRNPDFEGGRQFNLGANAGTIQEMEKQVGKSGMTEAVSGMVGELAANVAPEQQAVFREQLIKAATDPTARKAALDAARANGQDVAAMTRQLDLIKAYAAPAPTPQRTVSTNVGGLKPVQADQSSPAGRSQARQAQMRAEADKKEAERMAAQQALSKQFQADKTKLSPIDLARKYDATRGQLPTADAAELQRIESQAYRVGK